jgi:hypothetical protein
MIFTVGTNKIEDCEYVLAISGVPLFSVNVSDGSPALSVDLSSPPATNHIRIKNDLVEVGNVDVRKQAGTAAILMKDHTLLRVTVTGENDLTVDLDLRPIGLNVYTDHASLRVGGATLAGNVIRHCKSPSTSASSTKRLSGRD